VPAFTLYIGIDWATQTHQVCIMDAYGTIVREFVVHHTGESIREFLRSLEAASDEPGKIAVGIEVPRGPIVEALLERGYAVFAINPKQLDRFRDRHSVAGAKDDRRDAFVLADSLRTDQHCFRRLSIEPATVVRLRELARAEQEAGEELRRAANQLFQLLLRYYPQILELCRFPDEPWIWALLDIAPTPEQARRLTLARAEPSDEASHPACHSRGGSRSAGSACASGRGRRNGSDQRTRVAHASTAAGCLPATEADHRAYGSLVRGHLRTRR